MSEQQQAAQEEAIKVIQFKQQLHNQANILYRNFCDFVQQLPVNPHLISRALGHADDGILWVNEAIRVAELKVQPVDPDQNQEPKTIDELEATHTPCAPDATA
jgi:hypothetical protein